MSEVARASVLLNLDKAALEKDVLLSAEGAAGMFRKAFEAATGPVGILVGIGAAIGGTLLDVGEKFQGAFNTIAQKTGAVGAGLKSLEGDFKNVFATTPGANFKNVADALSEVEVRTHLVGAPLDDLTKKFVELGKITGTDVAGDVQSMTALFANFGVTAGKQGKELDVIFKASRDAGVSVAEFTASMQAAAPTAQILGLNVDQTAAIVDKLTRLGLPATKVMMGLGMEFVKAAKAGKDPTAVIGDMIAQIQKAPNATAAATIAIKNFGIGARQAATLVDAVRRGTFDFGATLAQITSGKGGIDATTQATLTLGDRFKLLKQDVLVSMAPAAAKVLEFADVFASKLPGAFDTAKHALGPVVAVVRDLAEKGFDYLGAHWRGVVDAISPGVTWLATTFGKVRDFITGTVLPGILHAFDSLVSGFEGKGKSGVSFFTDLGHAASVLVTWFQDRFVPMFKRDILPALQTVGDFIKDNLKPILIGVGVAIGLMVAPVATVVIGFAVLYQRFQVVRDITRDVVGGFEAVVGYLRDHVPAAFERVRGAIQPFIDLVKPMAATFKSAFEAIYAIFRDAFIIVGAIVFAAVVVLTDLWDRFGSHLVDHLKVAFDNIAQIVRGALQILKGIFDLIHDILTGKWGKLWGDILEIVAGIWNVIAGVIRAAVNILSTAIGLLMAGVSLVWSGAWALLKDAVSGVFHGVADVIGGIFDGIVAVITGAINLIIDVINVAIRAYNDIPGILRPTDKIHEIDHVGGGKGSISASPALSTAPGVTGHFAQGGPVLGPFGRPQLAVVHGGEYVQTPEERQAMLAAINSIRPGAGGSAAGLLHVEGDLNIVKADEKRLVPDLIQELRDQQFLMGAA
jgi:phage-related protein